MLVPVIPIYASGDGDILSPASALEISDGYLRGITGIPDAAYIAEQFTADVTVTAPDGTVLAEGSPVPADSSVTVDGAVVAKVLVNGDCDREGDIDLGDVSSALKHTAGWGNDICIPAADIDENEKVTLSDIATVLKYIAGWDVTLSRPILLDVSFDEYVLLANDPETDSAIVSAVRDATGKDVCVVTEVTDGEKYITVGKNLWESYGFMDQVRCRSLFPENAYMEVYGGNIYLTACGDTGIDGCAEYLASADTLTIPKGYHGTVGYLTGKSQALYAEAVANIEAAGLRGGTANEMTDDIYTALVNAEYTEPKNIIYMIGDGMGRGAVNAAQIIYGNMLHGGTLAMRHMPTIGSSQTYSDTDQFTDSAAGATALATGYKTSESTVAMNSDDSADYRTVLEIAAEKGKSTGVVATKSVADATPAAFTAHVEDRYMWSEIATQQLLSLANGTLDLVFGGGSDIYDREDVAPALADAKDNGVTYTKKWSTAEKAALPVAGLFAKDAMSTNADSIPSLSQMTQLALDKLSEDEDGFFLMVEGSKIDTYGHNNLFEEGAGETYEFDCAVSVVLRYVALHPDTVVIVTADHETGGLRVNPEWTADNIFDNAYYLMGRHHWANVPLYSIGYGTGVLSGAVENTDIAIFAAGLMGEKIGAESIRHTLFDMDDPEILQSIADMYPEWTEVTDEGLRVTLGPDFRCMSLPIPQEMKDSLAGSNVRTVNITYKNMGDTATILPSLTLAVPDGKELVEEWWNFVLPGEYFTQSYVMPASMIGEGRFSAVDEIIIGGGKDKYRNYIITDITVVDRPAGQ